MTDNQPDSAGNDADEYAALWAVMRTADDPAEALRELLADVWSEGHAAGHEDARAVQATYPLPTPNPHERPIPPEERRTDE